MFKEIDEIALISSYKFLVQKEYWSEKLAGGIEAVDLSTDSVKEAGPPVKVEHSEIFIAADLSSRLVKISKSSDASLYIFLLALLKSLIYRYTSTEDIIVISPVYKQNATDETINQRLFIRDRLRDNMTFKELVLQVRESTLEAYRNQDYPSHKLLEYLYNTKEVQDIDTIIHNNIVCVLDNIHDSTEAQKITNKLTFSFSREEERISGSISYDPTRYEIWYIEQIAGHFATILEQAIGSVNGEISAIEFLSEREKQMLLADFNRTETELPQHKTISEALQKQFEQRAENIALVFEGNHSNSNSLTFAQLNDRTNCLAGVLSDRGVGPKTIVPLLAEPSLEMIIGIFAILKTGGCFLPMDPELPPQRIRFMLEDVMPGVLLTQSHLTGNIQFNGEILNIEDHHIEEYKDLEGIKPPDTESYSCSSNPLYMIYTSGTSGKPKGVLLSNMNLINYINWFTGKAGLTPVDRTILTSSFAFDLGYTSLFPSLLCGAQLHLLRKESYLSARKLLTYIEEHKITYLKITPSLFSLFVHSPEFSENRLKTLRLILLGGEAIQTKDVEQAYAICGHTTVMNHYGPTEATIGSIAQFIDFDRFEDYKNTPTIGKPINNTQAIILDKYLKLLPIGIAGELCLSGLCLAHGYLNRPELTEERFINFKNPGFTPPDVRLYKTGDLARWLPQGIIECLGRLDHQVKIRGFRVELGEIENELVKHEKIEAALVVIKEVGQKDKYICAYIVPTASGDANNPSASGMREYLSLALPDYMIPAYFINIERIPMTPNGKVNTKALPEPVGSENDKTDYIAPRDEKERSLAKIWAKILQLDQDQIGIDDNFFHLGGHSLTAVRLIGPIHKNFGIELPLSQLFESPTIRELSDTMAQLEQSEYVLIEPVEQKQCYELSPAQKRLYVLYQLDKTGTVYNMPSVLMLGSAPDRDRLEKTFGQLINRHESFRTSFETINDEPIQRICSHVEFEIEYDEAGQRQSGSGSSENINFRKFFRPFDLSQAPLLRIGLLHVNDDNDDKYLLMLDMHHIVSDGISIEIFVREFASLYSSIGIGTKHPEKELPAIGLQYKDYSEWRNSEKGKETIKNQETYWKSCFEGEIPLIDLPTDHPRPAVWNFEGAHIDFEINSRETELIRALCQKENATLYMVLLALLNILLAKLTGQEDIVIGTPVAGRRLEGLDNIIGMFVNSLALRNFPSENKTLKEFIKEVKERASKGFENQEYPFENLVENVLVSRDANRNPIFDVMFVLREVEIPKIEISDFTLTPYTYENNTSKFDLTFTCDGSGQELLFTVEYSTVLFEKPSIERFVTYFKKLVSSVLTSFKESEITISDIELIDETEKNQLLFEFNKTECPYPADQTVHQLFEEQALRVPDRIALSGLQPGIKPSDQVVSVSYRQLNRSANRFAVGLIERGIQPGTIVAIMMDRSLDMVIAILAVLKAGGVYLPIDFQYPDTRINHMLKDGNVKFLVTTSFLVREFSEGLETIVTDTLDLYPVSESQPLETFDSSHLAYIIYTSGTSGRPKGAMLEHRGLANLKIFFETQFNVTEQDRILQFASSSFDASIWEIFMALLTGSGLFLIPRKTIESYNSFENYIQGHQVTVATLPPPYLSHLEPKNITSLRLLVTAGSETSFSLVNKWKQDARLEYVNAYGPTETTVCASMWKASGQTVSTHIVPIGPPITNTAIYILSRNIRLQPVNIPGELCIAGVGVARGYLNRPELTAEKFVGLKPQITQIKISTNKDRSQWGQQSHTEQDASKSPHSSLVTRHSSLLYKTGDLARWLPDGNVEFLGRLDQQVKIRGFRIEPMEIESCLLQQGNIKEAFVTDRVDNRGEKYLCAYVVYVAPSKASDLREYLSAYLPDHMIPAYFTELERIPLTLNGKVDRKALPAPEVNAGDVYIAPSGAVEKQLARLWSDVLGIDHSIIGVDNNFFALGGHSLKATVMVSQIHKALNVKIPLSELFRTPTIRGLAQYIHGAAPERYERIEPVEKREYYGLSSAQKRLYIIHGMDLESTAYNMPLSIPFEKIPAMEKLKEVFMHLIERHESLRTSFHMIDHQPVQKVHENNIEFEIERYGNDSGSQSMRDFIRPFDLSRTPLLRVGVAETGENTHNLMVDMHHIISDGVSMDVLEMDFNALVGGQTLPSLRLQYKDYSQWHHRQSGSETIRNQETWWLNQFEGEIPVLGLPTDYPRPSVQNFEGDTFLFELSVSDTRALKSIALQQGASLFMALLSLINILLSKLSGQDDIVIGSAIAGRRHADLENIIGMFVNTLPLRNAPSGGKTFIQFLNQLKSRTLEAFNNQEYQFEDLVEQIAPNRDAGRNPLFDIMYSLNTFNSGDKAKAAAAQTGYTHGTNQFSRDISKFDLTWIAMEDGNHLTGDHLTFNIGYSTKLFKLTTIQRFSRYFETILSSVVKTPRITLGQIEIMSEEEKQQVLHAFNNTFTQYPGDKSIHQLFEEVVENRPDKTAVVFGDRQVSYRQLNERSNRLAHFLRAKGVKPDTIVGLMLERSLEMIISILGILKAGGAYLPIAPDFPRNRITAMLEDCDSPFLVAGADTLKSHPESEFSREVISMDSLIDILPEESTINPVHLNHPTDLCYVIYTSGSTGKPKGNLTVHSNVSRVVRQTNYIDILPDDRILQLSNYAFDGSTFDIYGALLNGAALLIVSQEEVAELDKLAEIINSQYVSVFFVTTALFNTLVDLKISALTHIRKVLFGGERVSVEHTTKALNYLGKGKILHVYGPTETTVFASYYPVEKIDKRLGTIPIGKPLSNTTVYILDSFLKPVPVGVTGQICISGDGVSRGYLNNPTLTLEKFVLNPFAAGSGNNDKSNNNTMYLSGDLGKWLGSGDIEFISRKDRQVKIRGYRIEPEEISSLLSGHSDVNQAVVVVREEHKEDRYLCAYIVPVKGDIVPNQEEIIPGLREFLAKELPDYMIPSHFVALEKIPLTPNGKVDYKALPAPEVKSGDRFIAPTTLLQMKLAALWADVLKIEEPVIGIDSDFFQLGGHSLNATALVSRIHQSFSVKIPLTEVFRSPDLKGLAQYIQTAAPERYASIPPVEEQEYYQLSSAQKRLYILQQMDLRGIAYNMPAIIPLHPGFDIGSDMEKLETIFNQLIHRHESLRTSFHMLNQEPVQKVHQRVRLQVESYPDENGNAGESFFRPFDLANAPLLRVGITGSGQDRYNLMIDMPHIISDGFSQQVLVRDFKTLYSGESLTSLRLQYRDYAQWQVNRKESDALKEQQAFWLRQFEDGIPILDLPTDYPRPSIQSFEGSKFIFKLSAGDPLAFRAIARQQGASLFILLLSLINILLAKLSNQEDIVIGTPIAGRRHADLENIVGMFVNTLALRNYPEGEKSFRNLLNEIKTKNPGRF